MLGGLSGPPRFSPLPGQVAGECCGSARMCGGRGGGRIGGVVVGGCETGGLRPALFLLRNDYITGQVIAVDGGRTLSQ